MTFSFRGARLAVTLGAASALVLFGHQAFAGFQWTAPMGGANPAMAATGTMAPRAPAAPLAPVMSEQLPTSLDSMGSANSAPAPIATTPDGPANAAPIYGAGMTNDPVTWNPMHNAPRGPQNIMPAEQAPLASTGGMASTAPLAPMQMAPAQMAPVAATGQSAGMYDMAEGFGRDLPLVMAIRQIVPAQYGFVFDQGIDISSHVSWQGGQPWDVVLQNTLAPLGMQAMIRGNVVTIARQGVSSAGGVTPGVQVATSTVQTNSMQYNVNPMLMQASATSGPAPMVTDMAQATNMGQAMPNAMTPTAGGYTTPIANSATDLNATASWTAPRNSTLRSILEDWSQRVGVELYWASEYDYPVQSAVSVNGTFEDAVQTLLKGLVDAKPKPMGRLHPNLPNGPAVLVIETRQNAM